MATLTLKELKYNDQKVLVEMARKALEAKTAASATKATQDGNGNVISTTYATKDEVSALTHIQFEVATALPTTGQKENIIYLVPSSNAKDRNAKDEFIWIAASSTWEQIGSTTVDLSSYYTKDDIDGKFVVQVAGKGLSTEDFTTELKNKLEGVTAGATKVESSSTNGNIRINGTETTVYTPATGTVVDTGYVHTDNNYTTAEKNKLAGIAASATQVETSSINGHLKINGTDATVYSSAVSSSDASIDW